MYKNVPNHQPDSITIPYEKMVKKNWEPHPPFRIFQHLWFGCFGAVSGGNEASIDPAPQHLVRMVVFAASLGA
jgi:hypothetical protein